MTTVLSLLLWLSCGVEPEEPLFLNYHGYEYPVITEPSEIQVSDSIAALYREDAARLAVRIMLDVGGEAADEVEVPRDLWDALYNTILHFHDATELAARDTVVEMFPIHTFPSPVLRELIVSVDSTTWWLQAWKSGQRLTGNSLIDALLDQYDLSLERYYAWSHSRSHIVVLAAGRPLNIVALTRRFSIVDGVGYAEPNGMCCDGSDLTIQAENGHWRLEYSLGWGDCPSGCINRRYWTFSVSRDGTVAFTDSWGDTLPVNGFFD